MREQGLKQVSNKPPFPRSSLKDISRRRPIESGLPSSKQRPKPRASRSRRSARARSNSRSTSTTCSCPRTPTGPKATRRRSSTRSRPLTSSPFWSSRRTNRYAWICTIRLGYSLLAYHKSVRSLYYFLLVTICIGKERMCRYRL